MEILSLVKTFIDVPVLVKTFVAVFVLADALGNAPIFLVLTKGMEIEQKNSVVDRASLIGTAVILAFAFGGQTVLDYLHISMGSLEIAGGLLLLLVALELLTGKLDEPAQTKDVNVALVPLGTPLLAGPGAIVATMVFVQRIESSWDAVAVGAGIVAVHLTLWLTMRYSVVIIRVIKDSGVLLITRIAGLLLSAIAVQLVADAVRAFIAEG